MRLAAVLTVVGLASALVAQTQDYGAAYSFAERKPRTQVEQVIDKLLPSLVKVHGASGLKTIEAYATGLVVSDRGHILTLDQIMLQKGRTRVVLYDGSVHQAQLLPEEPRLGVRLLKIEPADVEGGLHPVWPVAGEQPYYRNGQFVVSLGNCFRLAEFSEKVSATFGVVVGRADTALRYRLSDVQHEGELILTDACNNPGHYGGGLFDLRGNWLGLNMKLLESKETNTMLSAAIPSRQLLPYLEQQVNGVTATEPVVESKAVYTGIVLFQQGGRASPPAYVDRVEADSPGAKAGLRPDDLIVRLGEFSIRSCKEFREILSKFAPGQTVQVTYKRATKVAQVDMTLAAEGGAR